MGIVPIFKPLHPFLSGTIIVGEYVKIVYFLRERVGKMKKKSVCFTAALSLMIAAASTGFGAAAESGAGADSLTAESETESYTEQEHEGSVFTQNASEYADGVYEPDSFSFSGGSGRVEITCDEVEIKDGQVTAALTFSSTSYEYVTVDGQKYYGTSDERSTTFRIPAVLNENMEISGLTTKMSKPHEISYQIFVGLADPAVSGEGTALSQTEDIPQLPGLVPVSAEDAEYAEYFHIYQYEQGISLIEIEESGASGRYLVVPENVEPAAGIEKLVTVITQPVEHAWIWSGPMSLCAGEDLSEGSWTEPDYKTLVKNGCDLAVFPAEALETDLTDTKEYFDTLGIPLVIERSEDEKSAEAQEEWNRVFDLLLGRGQD